MRSNVEITVRPKNRIPIAEKNAPHIPNFIFLFHSLFLNLNRELNNPSRAASFR